MIIESTEKERMIKVMTKEIAIHNLFALKLRSRVTSDREALDMAIKALEQTVWIPVSERLPEKQDCYLVTTKWKGSHSGNVYIETNMAVYREKPKEWDCVDVIAWMPLPEPYKEDSNGE